MMTVRDAVSRCRCAVAFILLVVVPLIILCSSLHFGDLICCCAVCFFLFAVAPLIPWFFVPSLVSFSLLLGALVLLYAVTSLNSFRLSFDVDFFSIVVAPLGSLCLSLRCRLLFLFVVAPLVSFCFSFRRCSSFGLLVSFCLSLWFGVLD